ncbi:hypothetical protein [Candidatus Cyanaurora vandensis]|uniref:hypothetical protein n=1 Tax=Candidatus Cyanaurora vandensis TaxID=2714958 RepID=UPI00257F131F|nr:hypothetical protein [Candidatus Cyanaurora vandensis]
MVSRPSQSIESRLSFYQTALTNATSSSEVQTALAEFGYDAQKLQVGQALYDQAFSTQMQQQKEYGEQHKATQQLNQLWETADTSYMRFVQTARVAFKNDPSAQLQLALNGRRKTTIAGWLLQASLLYTHALASPAFLASLNNYGITAEKLQTGQAQLQAVAGAKAAQEKEKGEAQAATQTRDGALEALEEWMDDFLDIARIALIEQAQFLEILGLKQSS